MVKLNTITRFLNKELKIRVIDDMSRNGLQLRASKEVKKAAFAVDACLSTFEKAKDADLLIVHHGLLWKGLKDPLKLKKKRINDLKKKKLSLYAAHLPLDKHKKYGNNIQLAKLLKLKNIKPFGKYHGPSIGYAGDFQKPTTIKSLIKFLDKNLKTKCENLNSGKKKIKNIAIVSGGGSSALNESILKKYDCFLTGEAPYYIYNEAKDTKTNVIIAGHYETETWGVKALMPLLKQKFNIQTIFINNPIKR